MSYRAELLETGDYAMKVESGALRTNEGSGPSDSQGRTPGRENDIELVVTGPGRILVAYVDTSTYSLSSKAPTFSCSSLHKRQSLSLNQLKSPLTRLLEFSQQPRNVLA
jgi:hypothetical protein